MAGERSSLFCFQPFRKCYALLFVSFSIVIAPRVLFCKFSIVCFWLCTRVAQFQESREYLANVLAAKNRNRKSAVSPLFTRMNWSGKECTSIEVQNHIRASSSILDAQNCSIGTKKASGQSLFSSIKRSICSFSSLKNRGLSTSQSK